MNRILLVTTMFVVAACATPSPELNQSEPIQVMESNSDELPQHSNPAEVFEAAEPVARDNESSGGVAAKSEGIKDIEAPSVSESPSTLVQQPQMAEPLIVCEKTFPTGSILPVRVCREQAVIDRNRVTDHELMDDIKNSTAHGASRL